MAIDVKNEVAAFGAMKTDRSTTDQVWQQIRNNMQPDDQSFTGNDAEGSTNRSEILDGAGEKAGELTASALHNSLSNPSTRWLDLSGVVGRAKLDDADTLWLMEATSDVLDMFDSGDSGFSAAQQIKYRSTVFYGMAAIFIEEKFGVGAFFLSVPLQEVYVNEGPDGRVNEVWRKFELTAAQAELQFNLPNDSPGDDVINNLKKPEDRQKKSRFLHITRPRKNISDGIGPKSMPIESIYINLEEITLVRESGFPEWPWSVPRWSKRAGEKYGRGRGHIALPDVKMAHRVAGATIESLEKNIDPALQLPDDGVMGIPTLARGGLNYVRSDLFRHGDPIRKINAGGATTLGIDYSNRLDDQIRDAFLNSLLTISADPRMSATQSVLIDQKSENILGPIIGSFEAEDLDPMVNRVLGIGIRSGQVSRPPENLQGKPLKIIYTSPLARRRRSGEVVAIAKTFSVLSPMAAIRPEIWDNFDFDATARIVAGVEGIPPGILRPLKEVLKKRAADAVKRQEIENIEQASTIASAAGAAAPALEVIQGGRSEAR